MIDVGKGRRFDIAVGDAGTQEKAKVRGQLLLDVEADAGAGRKATYCRNVGGSTDDLRQLDRITKSTVVAACQESGEGDLAGLAPQFVAVLDFSEPLVLSKGRIEISAAWNNRHIEEAAADGPVALVPFDGRAVIVAPGVACVVERAGVNQCPVHEIAARIVRIFVGVENIGDIELSNSNNQPVGGLLPGESIEVGVDVFAVASKIDRLPHEHALHASVGEGCAELVGFAARKTRRAERVAEPKALLDFRVDPEFRTGPELQSCVEREVPGLATLVRNKAVRAEIGRTEAW